MGSNQLRKLSEAALEAPESAAPQVWGTLGDACEANAEKLRHWDAVAILSAFTRARVERPSLYMRLAEPLAAKASRLAPKHALDIIAVYEANGIRPRALYVEIFHALIRLADAMYAEEMTATLQGLARLQLGNPTLVTKFTHVVKRELTQFRYLHLCASTGALYSLGALHGSLFAALNSKAKMETEMLTTEELQEALQGLPSLEYSWVPYEDLCRAEFAKRIQSFKTAEDVSTLADPFATLFFLQVHGCLSKEFLRALCRWCLDASYKPSNLTDKRPTAYQLAILHDRCEEFGMGDNKHLAKAMKVFISTVGGKRLHGHTRPQPLVYKKQRRYFRTVDLKGNAALKATGSDDIFAPSDDMESSEQDLFQADGDFEDSIDSIDADHSWRLKQFKPSGGESAEVWSTPVKSPKSPRRRKDPGIQRVRATDMHRLPFWLEGFNAKPKYRERPDMPKQKFTGRHRYHAR
jgi:hypothetical protein